VLIPPTQTAQPASQQASTTLPSVPPHSLVAFSPFLRLPGYAEVLLKERRHAQCLLRLVLGVTDDGEGGMCNCDAKEGDFGICMITWGRFLNMSSFTRFCLLI